MSSQIHPQFLLNGEAKGCVSVFDRGLLYGDGLFETIRVARGELCLWPEHMARLLSGCDRLGMPKPDPRILKKEAESLITGQLDAVIKIIVTRGEGKRGFLNPEPTRLNRFVVLQSPPDYDAENRSKGIKTRFCHTRLAFQPALAGLKHLNCLQQVIARNEWNEPDIAEGFMLDNNDCVVEGCMSNVFLVKNEILLTPDLSQCGVEGVMRQRVIDLIQELGLKHDICSITKTQFMDADEIFITNSLIGIWPVKALQGKTFVVGSMTKKLLQYLMY